MKKRLISLLMTAVLLLAVLAGCGKEPEPEPTPEPTPDPHAGEIEVTDGAGGTIWVDESHVLTPFSLDRYAFSVTNGIVNYAKEGLTLSRGIDVSEYQHEIDWQAVAASGVEFAIIRVGYRGTSVGALNADSLYAQNIQKAQAAGLKVGAYFYSQAASLMEAAEEAVFTAQLLKGYNLDLPVFYDWENFGDEGWRTNDVSPETVTACCLEFCKLLESEGIAAGVYSSIPHVYWQYVLDELDGLTVWMGDPGNWPEFYYEHTYWQYSFTGTVPGIEGNVDLDVLYLPEQAQAPQLMNMSGAEPAAETAAPVGTGAAG